MIRLCLVLCAVAALLPQASAHVRWTCPSPRNTNSGIKDASCGSARFNPGIDTDDAPRAVLQPGLLTVQWEETIVHNGSPFRIAISDEGGDEYEECILMDHIPHAEGASGSAVYTLTIDIPDIQCERCSLQLIQIMTDKIPTGEDFCRYDIARASAGRAEFPNNCHSNYHSCANVRINGTMPRSELLCEQAADWPLRDVEVRRYDRNEDGAWGDFVRDATGDHPLTTALQIAGLPDSYNQYVEGCAVGDPATPAQAGLILGESVTSTAPPTVESVTSNTIARPTSEPGDDNGANNGANNSASLAGVALQTIVALCVAALAAQ